MLASAPPAQPSAHRPSPENALLRQQWRQRRSLMRPLRGEIVAECAQLLLTRIQAALRALRRLHIQPRQLGLKRL